MRSEHTTKHVWLVLIINWELLLSPWRSWFAPHTKNLLNLKTSDNVKVFESRLKNDFNLSSFSHTTRVSSKQKYSRKNLGVFNEIRGVLIEKFGVSNLGVLQWKLGVWNEKLGISIKNLEVCKLQWKYGVSEEKVWGLQWKVYCC